MHGVQILSGGFVLWRTHLPVEFWLEFFIHADNFLRRIPLFCSKNMN